MLFQKRTMQFFWQREMFDAVLCRQNERSATEAFRL
jgi:hypothetical protein